MTEETPKPPEESGTDVTPAPTEAGGAPEPAASVPAADGQPAAQEPQESDGAAAEQQPAPTPQPVFVDEQAAAAGGEKPSGTAPLVLGILSLVAWAFLSIFFGIGGIIAIILGIIAIVQSKKVRKADPANGKAKAGKVTGIIGTVLGVLCVIGWIALTALGFSLFGNIFGGAQAEADKAIASIVQPSEEEREQMMQEFEEGFESSGTSLDDLGLTSDDIASWMFDGASYQQTGIQVADSEAIVTYSVTTNKFDTLLDAMYDGASELDPSKITSMSQAYKEIGKVMKSAMDSSTPSTKTIEVYVENDGTGWKVSDSEMESLLYDIFYYE